MHLSLFWFSDHSYVVQIWSRNHSILDLYVFHLFCMLPLVCQMLCLLGNYHAFFPNKTYLTLKSLETSYCPESSAEQQADQACQPEWSLLKSSPQGKSHRVNIPVGIRLIDDQGGSAQSKSFQPLIGNPTDRIAV